MYVLKSLCIYVYHVAGMFGPAFGGLLFKVNPWLPISTVVFIYFTVFVAVWCFYRSTIIQYKPTTAIAGEPDLTKSDPITSITKDNVDMVDSSSIRSNKGESTESTASTVSEEDSDVDLTAGVGAPGSSPYRSPVSVATDDLLLNNIEPKLAYARPDLKEKKDL